MNAITQRFHFEPGTLIAYDGYELVVAGSVKTGLAVRDRFVGEGETPRHWVIDDQTVQTLLSRYDVVIDDTFSLDGPDTIATSHKILRFEDHSEQVQREAQQREAWCLAAKAVLKDGPYTERRIKQYYMEIKVRAYDRQRLNDLGTINKNGQFTGRSWGAKSVSNFCKIYFGARKPHPRLLLRQPPGGNTTRRLSAEQHSLLDECCRSYLNTSQPSKSSIVKHVHGRFRQVRAERLEAGNQRPFPTPHANTIYRRLSKFTKLQLVIGREGYQEAQKQFSPTQHGVRALKPGELIELDFWKGDVFTFSKRAEFWGLLTPDLQRILKDGSKKGRRAIRQRLWICIALDVATRMPLGVGIAEKPNSRTVIEVLDQVMRDKSDISRLAGCLSSWFQHCGLGTIVVDTGQEFFNAEVQAAIIAAGGSIIYGRAAVPMDKPFIERFFGGLRTEFADELPGKTGFSPQCLVAYDKEGMAAFNTEEFRLLLLRHLVDYYPLREHAGLLGQRPIDAWRSAQKYGVVRPPLARDRRNATGLKLKRMLSKEGIKILGIPFSNPLLFPKAIQNGKMPVEVRLDPNDLREVTILLNGERVHLENQRPDLAHHSIRTLMAAIKKMTTSNPRDREFYEYVLAEHANWFAQKIKVGVQNHGLPSTEVTASEIDWFENSFCLKLQIIKTPGKTPAADIETLLDGGSGPGIYTAADIATEKANAASEPVEPALEDAPVSPTSDAVDPVDFMKTPPSASRDSPPQTEPATSQHQPKAAAIRRFNGKPKGKGVLS